MNIPKKLAIIFAGIFIAIPVLGQVPVQSDIPLALAPLAQELGCTSRETCETVFNADFKRGLELAEKYNIFADDPVRLRLAETLKTEVLTKLTSISGANFEEEIIKIAQDIVRNKPSLAKQLDINRNKVEAAQTIVQNLKQEGVEVEICSQSAELLSREELIACLNASKKLAEKKDIVKDYISPIGIDEKNKFSGAMIKLQEALFRGDFQELQAKNTEDLGSICLRPGSPKQCDDIARQFFGPEGIKTLAQARAQVASVENRYTEERQNFILTLPDGKTLTGRDEIGRACDQAFSYRNLSIIQACGDFAIKNRFSSAEEVKSGLTFIQSIQGSFNLDECRRDSKSCEQFIQEAQRGDFSVMRQIQDIMTAGIGFSPERCSEGGANPEIGNKCLEVSKRALPKLENLASQSPAARRIIEEIKSHVAQGEKMLSKQDEFQTVFQKQGGPGGCKSTQECFAYCSDSSHGPECLAFGARHEVFNGQEVIDRYQEYNTQSSGQIHRSNEFNQEFNPSTGFGGPSPECLAVIQAGDFAKAKEICVTPNYQMLPPSPNSQLQFQSTSAPRIPPGCPSIPTVSVCSESEDRVVSFSSPECGLYYRCVPKGDQTFPIPSPTTTYQRACGWGQYWNGTSCVNSNSDPSVGCSQAGGTWTGTTCQMPGTQNCPSSQYWNGSACANNTFGTTTCSSSQYWNGTSCVNTGTYTPPSGQKEQVWNSV